MMIIHSPDGPRTPEQLETIRQQWIELQIEMLNNPDFAPQSAILYICPTHSLQSLQTIQSAQ